MTINNFVGSINKSNYGNIQGVLESTINEFNQVDDYELIKNQVKALASTDFTSFGDKISTCIHICQSKLRSLQDVDDTSYHDKLNSFLLFLDGLNSIIIAEGNARREEQRKCADNEDKSYVKAQNVEVLQEQVNKLNLVQQSANEALDQIKNTRVELDTKIFSLLINTVSILGIFVAIAFAGLGVTSLFSDLDFAVAFSSKENFIRTAFFLSLVALLSYNLLLLLIYFIYKLSRPILISSEETKDKVQSQRFTDISLTPFFVIDGILLSIMVALLIWGLCTYPDSNTVNNNIPQNNDSYFDSTTIPEETDISSEITTE